MGNNASAIIQKRLEESKESGALMLSELKIDQLPRGIKDFTHEIQMIDLSNNLLQEIPSDTFSKFTTLSVLSLAHNSLSELPSLKAQNKSLMKIDFSYNKVKNFPEDFLELPCLQIIYGGNNNIELLPKTLKNMISLQVLDLNHNQICKINYIRDFASLISLDLSHNNVYKIPRKLYTLVNLEVLNLRDNHIKTLPAGIKKLTKLTHLLLGENELEEVPVELGLLSNLEHLDLRKNKFEMLPIEIGALSGKLQVLQLNENPQILFPSAIVRKQGTQPVLSFLVKEMRALQRKKERENAPPTIYMNSDEEQLDEEKEKMKRKKKKEEKEQPSSSQ